MENPWSPSAAPRCFRSQNIKRTERSSAGQKYVWPVSNSDEWLICVLPINWTLPSFGAGFLPAEAPSAQRRSKWFGGTQSAHGADSPSLLSGTVSAPEASQGGRDGQTGPAGRVSISGGQWGHLVRCKRLQTELCIFTSPSHSWKCKEICDDNLLLVKSKNLVLNCEVIHCEFERTGVQQQLEYKQKI